MAKITPKGDLARLFLLDHPEFQSPRSRKPITQLDDDYANRLASGGRRQLEAAVTPNRQALRGHILTPEHGPKGARPKLPEKAENYKQVAKVAKETRLTDGAPSAPSQRRTAALEGEHRPRIHRRERGESHIPFAENGEIYTRNSERDARAVLTYAADLNDGEGERVVLQVFDCSNLTWRRVFENRGHGQGINANALLALWRDHGGSLETFLLNVVNEKGTSSGLGRRITHICQYEITILPRPTAAVKALQEQVKHRK